MANLQAAYEQLKQNLRVRLVSQLKTTGRNGQLGSLDRESVLSQLRVALDAMRTESHKLTVGPQEQERVLAELADEVIGLGPLEALLADPEVTEVMVNGPHQIYVERHGRLERTAATFRDSQHLMSVVERLLDSAALSVTGSEPCVDASLPDGNRLNVIIPPVSLNGPVVTIRKRLQQWSMEDLLAEQSLSEQSAEFLKACVQARGNLVVSGGTSTGKTTLVSVLSEFIPQTERIITIENVAELELPRREHWIRLVARPHNVEGRGEVSLRMLVSNALRMRPDRIILGEARGGEALDVVQAMHTGHEGVITILHANSPKAALERLETLMLMSGLDLPPAACRMQIASALDLVVHMGRFADGSRRVSAISQVLGMTADGFELEDVLVFEAQQFTPEGKLRGTHRYTGVSPKKLLSKFRLNNVEVPAWLAT